MPNKSKAISEVSRAVDVADLDSERRVHISMYDLCAALGLALQRVAFAYADGWRGLLYDPHLRFCMIAV